MRPPERVTISAQSTHALEDSGLYMTNTLLLRMLMLKQKCMQGNGALRQTAARAQRTITMPQRPSRLDPSSERGRAANNGVPLTTLICLFGCLAGFL